MTKRSKALFRRRSSTSNSARDAVNGCARRCVGTTLPVNASNAPRTTQRSSRPLMRTLRPRRPVTSFTPRPQRRTMCRVQISEYEPSNRRMRRRGAGAGMS